MYRNNNKSEKTLKIIHTNIRSLNKNIHMAEALGYFNSFEVIIFTECWLPDTSSFIPQISGFNSHTMTSANHLKSGGVVIYVKEELNAT